MPLEGTDRESERRADGESATRASVTVGPFAVFFTNVNTEMRLPGHSHFALVTLHYRTRPGAHGFPAFATTYQAVQEQLVALTARPFRNATNEDVAAALWAAFVGWTHPAVDAWGGDFRLCRVELAVRGVPDAIGHADGFTTYTVEDAGV
jgi:hypothetical protein